MKALPPCTAPMVTTAGSTGETSRATIVCSATTTWAAATMGSAARCGLPPCPPRPWTTMRSRSTAAMSGPVLHPDRAHRQLVPQVDAHARTSTPSSPPSRMTAWAPPSPSSAGWKSTRTAPARPRAGQRARRRRRAMATWPSWPQACIWPGDARGVGRRAVLLDGQARPCPRAGARPARRLPRTLAITPVPPTPVRTSRPGRLEERRPPAPPSASPRRPARDAGAARAAARPCPPAARARRRRSGHDRIVANAD